MTDESRRAVAFVAAALISGKDANPLWDAQASEFFHFDPGQLDRASPPSGPTHVYDLARGNVLTVERRDRGYELYDAGQSALIEFQLEGAHWHGHDHANGTFFEGQLSGDEVAIYDFAYSRWFRYSI